MTAQILSPAAAREAVHLLVLQELGQLDKAALVLKGGVNLRFFFGSVRYSEDLDLDADPSAAEAIRNLIQGLFEDRGLARQLRALGIRQLDPGDGPNKDIHTTFRYKFGIVMTATSVIQPG
ncbi:MAG: nucleotidyl transferase AbiEii/AbiGii toxin family protein [Gemmatimonadota bacterium]